MTSKTQETGISTEQEEAEAQTRERLQREKELADIRAIITTPEGERVMVRLLEKSGFFHTACQGNTDPVDIGYRDGKRGLALWLVQEITSVDPLIAGRLMTHLLIPSDGK